MKFQVFRNGKTVDNFPLCGAYLFGTDGIAIRQAEISFSDGIIECKKQNMATAGLAVLWPVEGFGKILVPTTCLPERVEPYNLNVEIARGKLMQVMTKCEDWAYFGQIEGLVDISAKSRDLLIRAIQNISDPPLASKLADSSLKQTVVLCETLATKHAAALFLTRSKSHGFGRGCLGCKIDPKQIHNDQYLKKIMELFGFVTIPVNWGQIESEQDTYDFSEIDECIEVLSKKKLAISAGPLLSFSKESLPQWLVRKKPEFEKIRESAYEFVSEIVERYSEEIRAWRVISGLNAFNYFGFNFEQVLEMTRAANMAVKASSHRTLKIIEVANPWGEYYATTAGTIPPLVYMDMVIQSGINFDAFGLQMKFGKNQLGMHVRDMMQISAVLDYFGNIAKPLYITEVEVPSESESKPEADDPAGIWHQKWDQSVQAKWIEQFYQIAFSKPHVDNVTYSALTDSTDNTIAGGGLMTDKLEPKKSFETIKKLHEVIFNR